jgi:ATP-dependent helicase/DNAse subunit B
LRLRLREDSLARERYLFYSCVSRATEQVVLSYRSSDEEGNVELPSPFIDDVAELFVPEWRERRRRRLLADVVWPLDEGPTERERARARVLTERGTGASLRDLEARLTLGEAALGKVRHSEILSAGALESYAECPVKWLVERELQPRVLEPDPEPLVRGSVIHELLERLLRELDRPLTAESLEEANEILDRLLSEPMPKLARGRIETVRAAALRSIEADLRRYLAHEAASGCDWDAEALELRFGFEDDEPSLPALELEGGVRVRGVVDRVDVDGAGHAIVRDYKSGGKRAAYAGARWAQDRQLQVALYMLAVRELMGLEPVAGLYQPLGGDDFRSRGVFLEGAAVGASVVGTDSRSADDLREVLDDARARAVSLAARLRAGDLEPCPDTCSRDGCKYPGICRNG